MKSRRLLFALAATVISVGSVAVTTETAALAKPKGHNCPNPAGHYPPGQCKFTTSASTAPQGGKVNVSGSGYSASSGVGILLGTTKLTALNTNKSGDFAGTITIPLSTAVGQSSLSAVDKTGFVLSQAFTVTAAPTFKLSAASVAQGGKLTVSGAGFSKSCNVKVLVDSTQLATLKSTSAGAFSGSVTIPKNTSVATHTMKAADTCSTLVLTAPVKVTKATKSSETFAPMSDTVAYPTAGGAGVAVIAGLGLLFLGRRRRLGSSKS
jgi:hypothetical protein